MQHQHVTTIGLFAISPAAAQLAEFKAGGVPACSPLGAAVMAIATSVSNLGELVGGNDAYHCNLAFDALRGQVAIPAKEPGWYCPVHGAAGPCPYY